MVLIGAAPVDDTGSATGWQASVGTLLAMGLIGIGVVLALKWRGALFPAVVAPHIAALNAPRDPEPVARARARRALRQQYRELANSDPMLARDIGVGRPDVGDVDDGGLIDVNHVSADVLVERLRVSNDEAARIIEGREQRGGFLSVDELVVFAAITPGATESAREYAVFLPR
jgi:hypothetical protein